MKKEKKEEGYDWPGWSIESNPFGNEFDLTARKRMVKGSRMLLPLIKKYSGRIENPVLEVGSFFQPLVTPELFPKKKIFYWENDRNVIGYLRKKYRKQHMSPIYCDLNKLEGTSLLKLKEQTLGEMTKKGLKSDRFGAVVVSHVLNYIDYKLFLFIIKDFMKEDGLIFLNNVVDYGLPNYFSDKRPKNIPGILKSVRDAGFNVIEKRILGSPYPKYQKNKRLILAAELTEVKA